MMKIVEGKQLVCLANSAQPTLEYNESALEYFFGWYKKANYTVSVAKLD